MATEVSTRKIDADTHFNLTVDYSRLSDITFPWDDIEASVKEVERACSRSDTRPSELIMQHCYTAVENLE
ncbi:MAG: hypothetical protein V3S98_07115, partial [Dehalococcoidia bacterium]